MDQLQLSITGRRMINWEIDLRGKRIVLGFVITEQRSSLICRRCSSGWRTFGWEMIQRQRWGHEYRGENHFPGCHGNIPAPHLRILPWTQTELCLVLEGAAGEPRIITQTPKAQSNVLQRDQDSVCWHERQRFIFTDTWSIGRTDHKQPQDRKHSSSGIHYFITHLHGKKREKLETQTLEEEEEEYMRLVGGDGMKLREQADYIASFRYNMQYALKRDENV